MRLLILTAIIAAVTSSPLIENKSWPWQVGKEYIYDVDSYTWTQYEQSDSNGNSFKTKFVVRVLAPGRLVAKLENPLYAQVQGQLNINSVPTGLKYTPVEGLDHPFEILVDGGRVLSLQVPSNLPVAFENLLKGLTSALQVDLSTFGHVHTFANSFDKESFQGLFTKIEGDVTGDCETLYSVSPVSAEWRRELPAFAEDPVEITKTKNYDSCQKRVYGYGLPGGSSWAGIAYENDEKEFLKHSAASRILVGKEGTIYKSETMSSVSVSPLLFGTQKAEVHSYVNFYLSAKQDVSSSEWKKSIEYRNLDSLLATLTESIFFNKDIQYAANAEKLLQQMTPILQSIQELSTTDFLSKYNNLISVLKFLNSEQLIHMTNTLEIARTSKNSAKYHMWRIYRDALAQTGSVAAFKEIKSWILSKKIKGGEAALVLASVSNTLRYPTKEMMIEFFDFAFSPEVREQAVLNNTALLAATKFIRFGNDDEFIEKTVIPRLSQELKQAVEKGDSTAQVYVRVLGNLAHVDILKVFAPYLEGKIPVTKYLRTQMVISLKTLANTRDQYVAAVLFSILKNTAEDYEIRVAAAINIFMTYPSEEMMKVMAWMTHGDPSTQVRAVLANSIAIAAELKDPRFAQLAKAAQSVIGMIPKHKYGYRFSTDSIMDGYSSDDELSHFREVSFIGSEDNMLPVFQRGALRFRNTAGIEEDWFTLSVSDMQHLADVFWSISGGYRGNAKEDFKFSAKAIAQMLNMKRKHRCDLEGSFFLDKWNQQTLITFNEEEFLSFIQTTVRPRKESDRDSHLTKLLSGKQVAVVLPLAMGMPFVFEYSEPIAISLSLKMALVNKLIHNAPFRYELQLTYARNLDGRVGYLDTFSNVYASAGLINKLQFYIPLNVNMIFDPRFTLDFKLPEQDLNLIQMSVWPYTSVQKMDSLLTIFAEPATKFIERRAKVFSPDFKFGTETGTVFQLKGYTYSSDYKIPSKLFDADLLTIVRNMLYQKDVALTEFDFKYLASESQNDAVSLSFYNDFNTHKEQTGEMGPASLMEDVSKDGGDRREAMRNRVAAGIKSAEVTVLDMSAVFNGKQKKEYLLTAALGNSLVDKKMQAMLFYKGEQQINAVFKMDKPDIHILNFKEALNNDFKITYEGDIKFGNSENIQMKGFGERSDAYTKMLSYDPMAKRCLEETDKENFHQMDCYKMIIKAHAPDYFKATVTYKDLSPIALNLSNDIYELLKHMYVWEKEENILKTAEDGKIDIEAQLFYYDNYMTYKSVSKYGVSNLNIEGMQYYPYAMAFYEPLNSWERTRNWFTGYQNLPFCSVDKNKVWTFSGRSYDYKLTSPWHIVMLDESDKYKTIDLVVLARRPSANEMEVYISYKSSELGQAFELEIKPNSVKVKSDDKNVVTGDVTTYTSYVTRRPYLEYYKQADGVYVININNGDIRFIYNGNTLVIFTDKHRSDTRGICGQSTTEIRDDFMTPYGLVDQPAYYGAAFSLDGEFSDPKTAELKKEAKLKAYQPVTKHTNILRSDDEWSKVENREL
ncbi:unnamed protein product [Chrysodeixis includens]|uniref:Vitellogenin n=1 Tax=Chrysodeixis includens TaxID=689277 RepID=A0A9N8Q069_CHRIL|nr:unnamed protein product [Chrysodeixis includens]